MAGNEDLDGNGGGIAWSAHGMTWKRVASGCSTSLVSRPRSAQRVVYGNLERKRGPFRGPDLSEMLRSVDFHQRSSIFGDFQRSSKVIFLEEDLEVSPDVFSCDLFGLDKADARPFLPFLGHFLSGVVANALGPSRSLRKSHGGQRGR